MSTAKTPPDQQKGLAPTAILGVVIGLAAVVGLMLIAFALPAAKGGPHELPVAVSGPDAAVTRLESALAQQNPGAIDVLRVSDAAEVTTAITDRDAVGGISLTADGAQIQTAAAAGAPYTTVLKNVGASLSGQGQQVTYTDVAPYSADDPSGAGFNVLGLPLAFGGMFSALALSRLIRRPLHRAPASLAFAALAGVAVTGVLTFVTKTFDATGSEFWTASAVIGLGIAAVSLTVLGLESMLGYPGLAVGAVLMMFVANPLAGLSTGWQWLPHPWGTIGQLLPLGAAGELARDAVFFDTVTTRPLVVLLAWIALGLLMIGAATWRAGRVVGAHRQRNPAQAPTEANADTSDDDNGRGRTLHPVAD